MSELDRRRHEALDLRLQLRRNSTAIVVVLAAASLLYFGSWAVRSYRWKRRDSARIRAGNLARALAILSREDPDRLTSALQGRPNPRAAALGLIAKLAGAAGQQVIRRTV